MQQKHNKMVIMRGKKTVAIISSAGSANNHCRHVCVTGANVPALIVARRRRHGMGGYGWSTDGLKFGFEKGVWMQVEMFAK